MGDKNKKLCAFKKEDYASKGYRKLVDSSRVLCTKCGRTANSEKNLCKAEELLSKKAKKKEKKGEEL